LDRRGERRRMPARAERTGSRVRLRLYESHFSRRRLNGGGSIDPFSCERNAPDSPWAGVGRSSSGKQVFLPRSESFNEDSFAERQRGLKPIPASCDYTCMNTFFSTTTERLQRVTNRDQQSPDFTEAFSSYPRATQKMPLFSPLFTPCLPPVFRPRRVSGDGFDGVSWGPSHFLFELSLPVI
jgi:hypothetical protein